MPTTRFTGPDVSHHQGSVNWVQVANAGHKAAIIKCTEGVNFFDDKYFTNVSNARGNGLRVGAYHFLRNTSVEDQVENFIEHGGGASGVLAVLDVETSHNGSNPTFDQARSFCERFEIATGKPMVLYTANWWWNANAPNKDVFCDHVWIARYPANKSSGYGNLPPGNYTLMGWQWTSSFTCPGISGGCDMNDFYITLDEWDQLANGTGDDDMSAQDVEDIIAALGPRIDKAAIRAVHHLASGRPNALFDPSKPDNTFMLDAVHTTLNEVKGGTFLVDCPEKPGVLVTGDSYVNVSAAQYTALREGVGVRAVQVGVDQRAKILECLIDRNPVD